MGKRGLGQGTEATVNNPDSTCVAGEDLTASAVPRHSASSTEPRQIRNNNPGPASPAQPGGAWIDFACCLSHSLSEPPRGKRPRKITGSVPRLSEERRPVRLSGMRVCRLRTQQKRGSHTKTHLPLGTLVRALQELGSSRGSVGGFCRPPQ